MMRSGILIAATLALGLPFETRAANAEFLLDLTATCSVGITTSGSMAMAANGTSIGSENGGSPSSVTILSVGSNTVSIGAPTWVSSPVGYNSAGETREISYSGAGGLSAVSQAYTTQSTTFAVSTIALSTLTLNSRVSNAGGFTTGQYRLRSVVTCS